jgi:zinc transport system substrate-binding protein
MRRPALTALSLLAATPALAEVPQVVTDTGPVHALVSRVMAGVAEPARLLPPGISPHDFQMRPSDAAVMESADLVIWIGEGLVPWLAEPLATLAPDAATLELLETEGWTTLPLRTDAAFAHSDDHAEEEGDAHAGEEGDAHGEEEGHDEHAEEEGDAHGGEEGHADFDPHAWLDPGVASVWLTLIADSLSAADPDNAAAYAANAAAGQAEYAALQAELVAVLGPVAGRPYIVPHDALQYFEVTFGMPAAGAIALSDATAPGPARIAEIRDLIAAGGATCILTDPETSPEWAVVLAEGTLARNAAVDPDGANLAAGADLYPALMRGMAAALVACLGD